MAELYKKALAIDETPPRGLRAYLRLVLDATGDAGWGVRACNFDASSKPPQYSEVPRVPYAYGATGERYPADRYGALIICAPQVITVHRQDLPGLELFAEGESRKIPLALIHDGDTPEGIQLGPNDCMISAEAADAHAALVMWLGGAALLLSPRPAIPS
jgi:hypothetical protein